MARRASSSRSGSAAPAASAPTGSPSPGPGAGSPPASSPGTGGQLAAAAGSVAGYRPPQIVNEGAGVLLALIVWGWLVMPFLKGGMPQVRNVIKAKFVNKAADGSWLP